MTTKEFKNNCKTTIIEACKSEFGFAPARKDIVLLEASGDRTYIMFEVRGVQYQFNSRIDYIAGMQSIWCGKGTLSKYEK